MRRHSFRIRRVLAITTLIAIGLAAYRWWTHEPVWIGPGWGMPQRDLIANPPEGVLKIYGCAQPDYLPSELTCQVVALVEDLSTVSRALALETLEAVPADYTAFAIHFVEQSAVNQARIRSFRASSGREVSEHLSGALAAIMMIDQLNFEIPREDRVREAFVGPKTIVFASGERLVVSYTNDWGWFYLRRIEGPPHLLKNVKVYPPGLRDENRSHIAIEALSQPE